ncbi:MAG: M23 family metallopeptidase [Bacteroidota bacterium]|nr:M23 family metallopeptidase [Bacteroidota bacterium]
MRKYNKVRLVIGVFILINSLIPNILAAKDFFVDSAANALLEKAPKGPVVYRGFDMDWASLIPFNDQYLTWDTVRIHPYKFNMTQMEDTTTLVLADMHDCSYSAPVAGYVTSQFGPRTSSRYHYGIDLKLNIGDTVQSAFDGIVRISLYSSSYGNCIVVRHYNGLETLYGHLSWRRVKVGDVVRSGELIGYGGNTGRSSGPHLHFEVRYMGQAINPNYVFNFTDSTYALQNDTIIIDKSTFKYAVKWKNRSKKSKYKGKHSKYGYAAKVKHKKRTLVSRKRKKRAYVAHATKRKAKYRTYISKAKAHSKRTNSISYIYRPRAKAV